jgi:hypothetical protein
MPTVKDVSEPCEEKPHARSMGAGGNQRQSATPRDTRRLPPTRPPSLRTGLTPLGFDAGRVGRVRGYGSGVMPVDGAGVGGGLGSEGVAGGLGSEGVAGGLGSEGVAGGLTGAGFLRKGTESVGRVWFGTGAVFGIGGSPGVEAIGSPVSGAVWPLPGADAAGLGEAGGAVGVGGVAVGVRGVPLGADAGFAARGVGWAVRVVVAFLGVVRWII